MTTSTKKHKPNQTTTTDSYTVNSAGFLAIQAGRIPYFWGLPGAAKTKTLEAFAEQAGLPLCRLLLDRLLPEDVGGFKFVDQQLNRAAAEGRQALNRAVREYRPRLLNLLLPEIEAAIETPHLVFFDELSNCSRATQAASLLWLADGIGDSILVAAGNPEECGTNAIPLAPPVVNRLVWLEWKTDRAGFLDAMADRFDFKPINFPVLAEDWREVVYSTSALLYRDFLRDTPSAFETPGEKIVDNTPFSSLRSWECATYLDGAAISVGLDEGPIRNELRRACLSSDSCDLFDQWQAVKALELPEVEDIIRDPSSLCLPSRPDLARYVLGKIVTAIRLNPTVDRWEAGREIVDRAFEQSPELTMAIEGYLESLKPVDHTYTARKTPQARERKSIRLRASGLNA
jgi:hypothetical protein